MNNASVTVLKVVHVLFWVVFVGLCIRSGGMLVSLVISLISQDAGPGRLYMALELSDLYTFGKIQYGVVGLVLVALNGMKAYVAYLVLRIFKVFDLSKPFSMDVSAVFRRISYVALGAGVMAICAQAFTAMLRKHDVYVPVEWGAGEILFFAGVIYLLAVVFEHGARLQSETDLTV